MKIKIALIAIAAGIFFTFIIYNLGIDEFIIKYMAISFFYFLLFVLLSKKVSPGLFLFICCVTTPLLIDASVLITYPGIVPLRFPFSSLFPLLGCLCAYVYLKKSRMVFLILVYISFFFFYLSYAIFIPKIMAGILQKEKIALYDSPVISSTFYDLDKQPVRLDSLLIPNCNLIETYFVGCPACEEKYPEIKKIGENFGKKEVSIIYICNGNASDFEDFKSHCLKRQDQRAIYLYDKDSVLTKAGITGYPTEFLTKNKKIISVTDGFNKLGGRDYFQSELNKIKKILNENIP